MSHGVSISAEKLELYRSTDGWQFMGGDFLRTDYFDETAAGGLSAANCFGLDEQTIFSLQVSLGRMLRKLQSVSLVPIEEARQHAVDNRSRLLHEHVTTLSVPALTRVIRSSVDDVLAEVKPLVTSSGSLELPYEVFLREKLAAENETVQPIAPSIMMAQKNPKDFFADAQLMSDHAKRLLFDIKADYQVAVEDATRNLANAVLSRSLLSGGSFVRDLNDAVPDDTIKYSTLNPRDLIEKIQKAPGTFLIPLLLANIEVSTPRETIQE